MRILLINPNTSEEFTKRIQHVADQYAAPGTSLVAINPTTGPKSIESVYDEILSSLATLECALQHLDDFDAFVIACYSDHSAIYAIREITEKPVLGIAEASMYVACMVGYKFSIVSTEEQWEPLLWDAVHHYGLADRCASVRTTRMPVLELESASPEVTYQSILKASQQALEEEDADVICLGCAGMGTGELDKRLQKALGVPVLDGVVCAVKLLEGLIGYGLSTSKRRVYAQPDYKPIHGLPKIFQEGYRKNNRK
ncbi:MAG: aspartate/glutamate racemase family protein [Candidatus Promineifilaceae bacterium]|nr:aspartate/glutamate racemase family protein [Candidatus Promineifilaceae bacterium]